METNVYNQPVIVFQTNVLPIICDFLETRTGTGTGTGTGINTRACARTCLNNPMYFYPDYSIDIIVDDDGDIGTTHCSVTNQCLGSNQGVGTEQCVRKNQSNGIKQDVQTRQNVQTKQLTDQLKKFIIESIHAAHKYITQSKYSFLTQYPNHHIWKISINHNIFFNCPFTLHDIIFLPLDFIKKCSNTNTSYFITTLVHEKLHVSQRLNTILWSQFVYGNIFNNVFSWIKIPRSHILFSRIDDFTNTNTKSKYKFIKNPDIEYTDFKYILFYESKYYYGNYVLATRNLHDAPIKIVYFQITFSDMDFVELDDDIILKFFRKNLVQEHPFEYYAYKLSEEIYNGI